MWKINLSPIVLILYSGGVLGAPWLPPGDVRARHAIQKLSDQTPQMAASGTWPINWAQIQDLRANPASASASPAFSAPQAYLQFETQFYAQRPYVVHSALTLSDRNPIQGSFSESIRERAGLHVTQKWTGHSIAAGLSVQYVEEFTGQTRFRFDQSYLAARLGDLHVGAGAIDRWWGPGWESSLILSNHARPMPAVWAQRWHAQKPSMDALSWIGPWQWTAMISQADDETHQAEELVGARITAAPFGRLAIGLSHLQGLKSDSDQRITALDTRLGMPLGAESLGLYAQWADTRSIEDEPIGRSSLYGIDWTSEFFQGDQQWFLEWTNALPLASEGYTHHDRGIASFRGQDTYRVSLGGYHFFDNSRQLGVVLTRWKPDSNSQGWLIRHSFSQVLGPGKFTFDLQWADSDELQSDDTGPGWRAAARWELRY